MQASIWDAASCCSWRRFVDGRTPGPAARSVGLETIRSQSFCRMSADSLELVRRSGSRLRFSRAMHRRCSSIRSSSSGNRSASSSTESRSSRKRRAPHVFTFTCFDLASSWFAMHSRSGRRTPKTSDANAPLARTAALRQNTTPSVRRARISVGSRPGGGCDSLCTSTRRPAVSGPSTTMRRTASPS